MRVGPGALPSLQLYSITWCQYRISYQCKSYQYEFIPVIVYRMQILIPVWTVNDYKTIAEDQNELLPELGPV